VSRAQAQAGKDAPEHIVCVQWLVRRLAKEEKC
jgi:hypothetical protein